MLQKIGVVYSILLISVSVFVLLYCLGLSSGYYFDHDEHAYISAAILSRELDLYTEFLYNQTPLYPIIIGFASSVFDFDGVADYRLINPILMTLIFIALHFYFRILDLGNVESLSLATIFVFSEIISKPVALARNDVLALTFFCLGAVILALAFRNVKPRLLLLFFAGLVLSLAVSVKVTYLFGPVGAGLAVLLRKTAQSTWRQTLSDLGVLAAGGIVASLPMLIMLAQDWDRVFFSIYSFHRDLTVAWLNQDGVNLGTRFEVRMTLLVSHFGYGASILFLGMMAWTLIVIGRDGGAAGIARTLFVRRFFLPAFWVVFSFALLMMTLQMSTTYVLPFYAALFMFFAHLFGCLPDGHRAVGRGLLVTFAVFAVGTAVAFNAPTIYKGISGERTAVERQDAEIAILRDTVPDYCGRRVASLTPTAPLLAGLPIYPELAMGVFFFRGGDVLSPERIRHLNGVTPRTLSALLTERPPAAIYAGSYSNRTAVDGTVMNQPFVDFAEQHGYVKNPGGKKSFLDIYVRPSADGCEDAG